MDVSSVPVEVLILFLVNGSVGSVQLKSRVPLWADCGYLNRMLYYVGTLSLVGSTLSHYTLSLNVN